MIRTARPTDVVALAAFATRTTTTNVACPIWSVHRVDNGLASLPRLFFPSVARMPGRRVYVACLGGTIHGLAGVRSLGGHVMWRVDELRVDDFDHVAEHLLDHLANAAAARGARRLFMQVAPSTPGIEIARRAGFQRYSASVLYVKQAPFDGDTTSPAAEARPRRRQDEHGLFGLYKAAVPARVRMAEAANFGEWAALQVGEQDWAVPFLGRCAEYVLQSQDSIIGCIRVRRQRQGYFLSLLGHPEHGEVADALLDYALGRMGGNCPVHVRVRDYQMPLASALEARGFEPIAEADDCVRQLAIRVAEPRLVPANVVGGCM